jgi:hypothetical protein
MAVVVLKASAAYCTIEAQVRWRYSSEHRNTLEQSFPKSTPEEYFEVAKTVERRTLWAVGADSQPPVVGEEYWASGWGRWSLRQGELVLDVSLTP